MAKFSVQDCGGGSSEREIELRLVSYTAGRFLIRAHDKKTGAAISAPNILYLTPASDGSGRLVVQRCAGLDSTLFKTETNGYIAVTN